uniref:Uncharacterized protein n=1 Tax=viral metagenome TaxID=1070528 RepID=A0A6H2A525_9ZZZZ
MAGTPPEDLMEWLLREEERLGADTTERMLADIDVLKEQLREELGGLPPTANQLAGFLEAGHLIREKLPELGIQFTPYFRRGYVYYQYRDIVSQQWMSAKDVWSALGLL